MNKVILIGNVGNDPEIKEKFATFTIATNETYKNKDGEKVKNTEWHSCTVFGKTIDLVKNYVKKGNKICVEGSIKYTKKDEKFYTNINVRQITLL